MLFTLFCIVSVQDLYALEQLQSTRPNFFPFSFIDCFVSQHDILNQYGFPFAIAPYKWRPYFPCTRWHLGISRRSRSSTSRTTLHLGRDRSATNSIDPRQLFGGVGREDDGGPPSSSICCCSLVGSRWPRLSSTTISNHLCYFKSRR